jgi:hypothetical protein
MFYKAIGLVLSLSSCMLKKKAFTIYRFRGFRPLSLTASGSYVKAKALDIVFGPPLEGKKYLVDGGGGGRKTQKTYWILHGSKES